ncbi:uncharacterized protein LOC111123999 isoform X2 [Crassostrea virginica]
MKFYVHTEEPPFTMVVKWNDSDDQSLQKLIEIFLGNFKLKYFMEARNIDESTLEVWKGKKSLNICGKILQSIKNMDDLYIKWKPKSSDQNDTSFQSSEIKNQLDKPTTTTQLIKSEAAENSSQKKHIPKEKNQSYSVQEFLEIATTLSSKQKVQHAIVIFKDILNKEPHNQSALVGIADCYFNAGRPADSLVYLKRVQNTKNDTAFKLGKCYVEMGKYDKAIETLMEYCKDLRTKGGTTATHKQDVQVWLAKAYIGKKQTDMALVVLQGVLRENQEHLDALIEYAPLIYPLGPKQKEEAMTILLTVLVNKRATEQAEALMKHAYLLDPANPHTLLTYIHTLELIEKHTEAVQEVLNYIKQWPEKEIGNFRIGSLLPILNHFHGDVYLNVPDVKLQCASVPVITSYGSYSEDMNYLLAILFTLVKILFIKGANAFIRPISSLIDPLTKGHELHKTNIRNEAAYFSCISQLQGLRSEVSHVVPGERYVYFVGDSHCIPPAWQSIQIKGEERILHPILSTGTKIWHLREESTFYPKYNFNSAVAGIPDGALTIFCFGEIDCREALLLSVEKAKYDSLEEAIDCVVEIYISLLIRLKELHHWDIYIHPVLPVLDLTRSVVMQFNQRMMNRVQSETSLKWLDFVDSLLTKESGELLLKKDFEFDGTHVHPCYLKLLEESLQQLP